jgi:uncharacterized protein (DUF2235 family)
VWKEKFKSVSSVAHVYDRSRVLVQNLQVVKTETVDRHTDLIDEVLSRKVRPILSHEYNVDTTAQQNPVCT